MLQRGLAEEFVVIGGRGDPFGSPVPPPNRGSVVRGPTIREAKWAGGPRGASRYGEAGETIERSGRRETRSEKQRATKSKISEKGQKAVVGLALARTDPSLRELACRDTVEKRYLVSESSISRILRIRPRLLRGVADIPATGQRRLSLHSAQSAFVSGSQTQGDSDGLNRNKQGSPEGRLSNAHLGKQVVHADILHSFFVISTKGREERILPAIPRDI